VIDSADRPAGLIRGYLYYGSLDASKRRLFRVETRFSVRHASPSSGLIPYNPTHTMPLVPGTL
jgi:hypothetical protein